MSAFPHQQPVIDDEARAWAAWIAFVLFGGALIAISTAISLRTTGERSDEVGLVLLTAAGLLAVHEVVPALARISRWVWRPAMIITVVVYAVPAFAGLVASAYALKHSGHLGSASTIALGLAVFAVGSAEILVAAGVGAAIPSSPKFVRRWIADPQRRRESTLVAAVVFLIAGSFLQWLAPFLA